jgi:energy-coupling factor transporter transmembrane protein EcfT
VVLLGLLLVSTTRASQIKAAVEWFLTPVPGIPEKRVGTMISLLLRFLPLFLHQARQTADAQRARGIENRKNPLKRLTLFALPLLRRTFIQADRLALAMEARCYTDDRTGPRLSAAARDWLSLAAVAAACLPGIGLW